MEPTFPDTYDLFTISLYFTATNNTTLMMMMAWPLANGYRCILFTFHEQFMTFTLMTMRQHKYYNVVMFTNMRE
jgi:hypothetical protein